MKAGGRVCRSGADIGLPQHLNAADPPSGAVGDHLVFQHMQPACQIGDRHFLIEAAGDGDHPGQAGYGLIAWLVLHGGWGAWLGVGTD